ncbi:MAG TPA: IS630 family transposase [Ktedonobacterales bacterium]|nr:IS630 family transposase [Ktedonobacterales bacterium]
MDESELHTHPTLAKVWRRRGQPMRIPAAGDDHKCVIFGALDSASGRVVYQINARKDEDAFMTFLDELAHAFPANEPVVMVLDNASYHKSHAVQAWWRAHAEQCQPFFLPVYSPQLNLIERLWRDLKDKLACHRWWNDLARLQQAAQTLLTGLEVHFHATDGPAFRPPQNFRETA